MNEFYESILNIKKCSRDIVMKKINEIIIEELNDVTSYVNNMEGLCKVLSNNIKCRLDNENIRNFKVNIKNLGAVTDHEFLIASFKNQDNKTEYILIDTTYCQFTERKEKPLHFENWPSKTLSESNRELLANLLKKGFTSIDENSFKDYINSFEIDYSFEDILLNKGDNYETNFKNHKK